MASRARGTKTGGEFGPRPSRSEPRRALEAILRERRGRLWEPPAANAGPSDIGEAAREQVEEMVWLAVLERGRGMQVQVEEALARLAAGRYGRCTECGEAIPSARLQALPFALRCLPCQERLEEWGEGRPGAARTIAAP
jgi:DnaK suppressor protein